MANTFAFPSYAALPAIAGRRLFLNLHTLAPGYIFVAFPTPPSEAMICVLLSESIFKRMAHILNNKTVCLPCDFPELRSNIRELLS
jgi:hypothetical protein